MEYELNRIEMYNDLINMGTRLYGNGFVDALNRAVGDQRNAVFRPVKTALIQPSQNLDLLALQSIRQAPEEVVVSGIPGKVVRRVLNSPSFTESEWLSFLLFTPTYIRKLIDLGYQDAEADREKIVALFS